MFYSNASFQSNKKYSKTTRFVTGEKWIKVFYVVRFTIKGTVDIRTYISS